MSKVVFITGATSGIGRATALRFCKEGWKVIATGRRQDKLDELMKEAGNQCITFALDVQNKDAVNEVYAKIPTDFKPIDVLINNAGLALGLEMAPKASLDDWETMINTNIKGLLYCTKALMGDMVARNQGHIVNIGSIAGFLSYPGANVYGATKAFVDRFSDNLRSDLHGTALRVTNIEPGLLETEFSIIRFKGDTERADNLYKGVKPLLPEDIADAIWYATNVPSHININKIEIMPVCQYEGGSIVAR